MPARPPRGGRTRQCPFCGATGPDVCRIGDGGDAVCPDHAVQAAQRGGRRVRYPRPLRETERERGEAMLVLLFEAAGLIGDLRRLVRALAKHAEQS